MRIHKSIMLFGVIAAIGCPTAARADLTANREGAVGVQQVDAFHSLEQTVLSRLTPWSSSEALDRGVSTTTRTNRNVVMVPPGPSSVSLFLSALAGVGAWQLGRNAHKLHLGALPEWYHAGGPSQIGSSTPFDLSFSLTALPICGFENCLPAGKTDLPPAVYRLWGEPASRIPAGLYALPTDPRGPPTLS